MDKQELKKLQEPIISLAIRAGARILDYYRYGCKVKQKEDKTPLTQADLEANEIIQNGLQKLTPDIPILSEEAHDIPFSERQQWSLYWLVDPLDGTREFINRTDEFTVNIALIENGLPILGLVHAPELECCYFASRGQGAYKKAGGNKPRRIQVKKKCRSPVIVAGSRAHRTVDFSRFLENIGDTEVLSMGSALKSCLVAEGKADVYARLGPTSEWDTAAAQCIVEEAGGLITDTNMERLRYNTKECLLNPHFFVFGDQNVDWSSYL
ncbi:MAG: 3'(2'),5'-bisphosphate nucleotidase CysQ [Gammaproteobacteria bacterium]|nr:3'(2'),5'-bisphosphate nucleotidase CysQ [Gammaproteobacteria bacterium]MDH5654086.1 3'(2'),5'-bisphosphate nucleotidase CysQ [Gammaproteobacteria bacterium]